MKHTLYFMNRRDRLMELKRIKSRGLAERLDDLFLIVSCGLIIFYMLWPN